jgi:hypothetical protein
MRRSQNHVPAYLEIGRKRTFAGAIDWPGWCRSGPDEESALAALADYGPRYARVLRGTRFGFQAPSDVSAFSVMERLEGNATTDFGAPAVAPSSDTGPIGDVELRRLQGVLRACWRTFDAVVREAQGKELRKGPRGGGRELGEIVEHVLEADGAYLGQLGWKYRASGGDHSPAELGRTRGTILEALAALAPTRLPRTGPRGGARWTPRYFVRRVAWHVLDHTWEIQDRVM